MKLFNNKYFLILIIIVVSVRTGIYYTNPVTGIINGINIGLGIIIPFLLITYLLEYFFKPNKLPKYINVVLLIPALFLLFMQHKQVWFPPPEQVFNRVFNIEKPKSITDLKAYTDYPGKDVIFRLKFKINKVDLDNIIKKFKIKKAGKLTKKGHPDVPLTLGVSYLDLCKKLSWWDIKHLKPLPQYEWLTEYDNPRTLWMEHLDSNVYIIHVTGIGWG